MSEKISSQGSCLCGKVQLETSSLHSHYHACHCGMCRKWGGVSLLCVNADEVKFTGEDSIGIFDSSDWAERGFCKNCGTHLFYHLKGSNEYSLPVGLMEGTDNLQFASQIFIDRKPGGYSFANETKNMTEAEVFAMYAPKE